MPLVNQHELAALLGRSRTAIVDWVKLGLPVARTGGPRGEVLYDVEAVSVWLKSTGRGQRPELPPMPLATPEVPDEVQTSGRPAETPTADAFGYLEARARREKMQAKLAELEVLERVGALVSRAQVRRETYELWTEVRSEVQNALPRALDQKLAGETDTARRQATWDRELREFLSRLAARFEKYNVDGGTS